MRPTVKAILGIATLLLLSLELVWAQVNQVQKDSLITEMLSLSGVHTQLDQLPPSIHEIFTEMKLETDEATTKKVGAIIDASFRADSLYASMFRFVRKNFDKARVESLLAWLHTPQTQKIIQLEIQAGSPEGRYQISRLAAQLRANPPSANRANLVQRLDDITGASQFSVDLTISSFRTLVEVLNEVRSTDEQISMVQLDKGITEMRKQLPALARASTTVTFLYTYRSLYDKELLDFIDYYSSDNGRWFLRALYGGLTDAVNAAAARMVRQTTAKR